MTMKKILFIGRFQPFHLGHLSALKDIDEQPDTGEIVIGIGSAQYSRTIDNPYSLEERRAMLQAVLPSHLKNKFSLQAIPDVHDNNIWVDHVRKIVGDFDQVWSGNQLVRQLFEQKNYLVFNPKKEFNITATQVRRMITDNDEGWRQLVSPQVAKIICQIKL